LRRRDKKGGRFTSPASPCVLAASQTRLSLTLPANGTTTIIEMLADDVVVGRIMEAAAAPVGQPSLWMLAFRRREDRAPTPGYEPREAAMGGPSPI